MALIVNVAYYFTFVFTYNYTDDEMTIHSAKVWLVALHLWFTFNLAKVWLEQSMSLTFGDGNTTFYSATGFWILTQYSILQ